MAQFVRKIVWALVFILVLISAGQIDYYYGFSDQYRNSPAIVKLAALFGIFPDGEEMMNFNDWIIIHATVLFSLIPFSLIRLLAPAAAQKNISVVRSIKKIPFYYLKVTLIAIGVIFLINPGIEII